YAPITATQLDQSTHSSYAGFADIASLVQTAGSGTYSAADVQATLGANMYAGWAMVVVYRDPSQVARNITVFDGYSRVSAAPVPFTVSGFTTPLAGQVNTSIGVVAFEGDENITGD